jgi:hypothetical protein
MGADIQTTWTCDWCDATGQTGSLQRPSGWAAVVLPGVDYSPNRDLCSSCRRRLREVLPEFYRMASGFWLSKMPPRVRPVEVIDV